MSPHREENTYAYCTVNALRIQNLDLKLKKIKIKRNQFHKLLVHKLKVIDER